MAAFNGIAYTAKFYEPIIEDNVWTGVLDIRTSDYLEATAKDGVSYAQVLASLVPVYFTEVTSSYTLTTTAQITSGSVAMQLTEGGEYTFKRSGWFESFGNHHPLKYRDKQRGRHP